MLKERTASLSKILSRPFYVFAAALFAAALYALFSLIKFSGDKLFTQFYYVIPIIFPFVAFLAERALNFRQSSLRQKTIDAAIVITAMWRVVGDVPYISGHALFLMFALLTVRAKSAKIAAAIVLLEVGWLKIFVWHDWLTFSDGIILAAIAALVRRDKIKDNSAANNTKRRE